MSCWRVLELSEQPDGKHIPQLLIKPAFDLDSYIVHLTDLSNIWCEELDVHGIVRRAAQEQSPIEVSKQDTAQLAILLENVKKPLISAEGAICRVSRNDTDGLTLHTSISLPEPLERLTWKFHLNKRTSATLRNELILPLLVSSHIQNERITKLISTISQKDKAITRLVDQFEANNMDLASAFPSVGGTKAGRKMVKREQAARHVPALRPFREEAWRQETEQLEDTNLTTLGLFQEALAQSTPRVPSQLKSGDHETTWWTSVPTQLSLPKASPKDKAKKPTPAAKSNVTVDSDEEETEDEFETHENFNIRNVTRKPARTSTPIPSLLHNRTSETDSDNTEDEEDLDAPPKSESQSQGQTPTSEHHSSPKMATHRVQKAKVSNFQIGGKPRRATQSPPPLLANTFVEPEADIPPSRESEPPSHSAQSVMATKMARKPFKIGGKGKIADGSAPQRAVTASPSTNRIRATQSPISELLPSPAPLMVVNEIKPIEKVHEETPEEKAERKRAELKRKNEEAAKKQAQSKKKKRF